MKLRYLYIYINFNLYNKINKKLKNLLKILYVYLTTYVFFKIIIFLIINFFFCLIR